MPIIQVLRKWGNSAGIRLPKEVLEAAQLTTDQSVEITVANHVVTLTPIKEPKQPLLEKLLAGVTPELVGGELPWGDELGAEVYE